MKVLDIYAIMQDDITSIIQRKHHPDTIGYEYLIECHDAPPTHKHWKRLLHEIYVKSPGQYSGDDNILAKAIGITGEELYQTAIFLIAHDIILLESSYCWRITQKGFDIALQNEKIESDKHLHRYMLLLMFFAIFISVVSLVVP